MQPHSDREEELAADAFERYWDAVASGSRASPDGVDPAMAALTQQLFAARDALQHQEGGDELALTAVVPYRTVLAPRCGDRRREQH